MKENEKTDFFSNEEKMTIDLEEMDKESAERLGIKINRGRGRNENRQRIRWYKFPIHMLCVLIFLIVGFMVPDIVIGERTVNAWHWCWIILLIIPMYYGFVSAVIHRNANHFPYPVLVVAAFMLGGIVFGLWNILWALFFTIPLYYWLIGNNIKRFWRNFPYSSLCVAAYVILGLTIPGFWHPGWLIFLTIPIYDGIVSMFKK